jgi:hypothetical protein
MVLHILGKYSTIEHIPNTEISNIIEKENNLLKLPKIQTSETVSKKIPAIQSCFAYDIFI